ncbi:MAG: hypothetical protein WC222_11590 [Parachlamydiales bacterium]|jgi:hypothetical protein
MSKINDKSKSFSKTFKSGNDQISITFIGEFIPKDPGVHTFRNGDPGYPSDGPYFTIEQAEANGNIMPFIEVITDFYDKKFQQLKEKHGITWNDYEDFMDNLGEELADELEIARYQDG